MRDAHLCGFILRHLFKHLPCTENLKNVAKHSFTEATAGEAKQCKGFLCRGECFNVSDTILNDLGEQKPFRKSFNYVN